MLPGETLRQLLGLICGLHVCNTYVGQAYRIFGPSMFPTFNATDDIVLVERFSTRFQKVKAGDIVMAVSPEDPALVVCKRLLAVEGDNFTVLPEPLSEDVAKQVLIPKGHVWLQGDNPSNSRDSRHYGPVPYALLQGKVCLRIWPPFYWGKF
ncbi:hypothetical protein GOP47_0021752 [Adiantum capillus-veneris]|uniref:Peptidase S26 domain-containing protein n=1 Tax=Adiantum capillus-veneris TaxID=13818 RepID=A0A9D4Z6U9_ADICA|nr:hypothetical protein GOP47_0021752 [Adiantum capillus-veneris]